MREVIERNALAPEDMVSCIFTCTEDLDAEFPAVAARNLGLSACRCCARARSPCPARCRAMIRLLLHCYADEARRPATCTCARRWRCGATWRGRSEPGIEFNRRLEAIPVYPAAESYDYDGELVKLASNETPWGPPAAVIGAIQGRLETLNRYPDPDKAALRGAIAERSDVPPARVAVGNGSCEILLAAADALLEPGAELVYAWPSFSMYPQLAAQSGARAITVPLDDDGSHDLDAMAARGHRRHPAGARLQPQQPHRHGAAAGRRSTSSWPALPAPRGGDPRRGLRGVQPLQDPDDSLDLLKRHPNLVLLRTFSKVYGLCGLRAGYALGLRGVPPAPWTACASPSR